VELQPLPTAEPSKLKRDTTSFSCVESMSVFTAAEKGITQQIDTLFTTTYGHYAELFKVNIGRKDVNEVLFKQLAILGWHGWVRVQGILLTDCAIASLNYNTDAEEILYSMTIKFRGIREV
jgi:hypothetical protein